MTGSRRGGSVQRRADSAPEPKVAAAAASSGEAWISRNALALVALAPVVFATARLIAFSGGDTALLAALVQSLDVPAVLIGSLAPALGAVLGYVLFVVIANRHVTPRALRWFRHSTVLEQLLLFLWLFLAIFATPWPAVANLIYLPLAGVIYRWLTGLHDRRVGHYVAADVVAVVASALFTFLSTPIAWMPAEVLTLADGTAQTVYVVESSDGWMTTVTVTGMRVGKTPVGDVVSREVCEVLPGRSLLRVMHSTAIQPSCPEDDAPKDAPTERPGVTPAPDAT